MVDLVRDLVAACARRGLPAPARATLYACLGRVEPHRYRVAELPAAARRSLYNLGARARVPGHQLAFYCFNYGDLEAMSFAAGLPWLDLYQAARLGGWRPRSRGLLASVLGVRGAA
jgi:hypothetical protein